MNTKLTKLISLAAVLAAGSTSYAGQKPAAPASVNTFEQGYEINDDKFPAAYNAAARVDVQCSWDIFATGSFIYWHVDQDGMDYGRLYNEGKLQVQDFGYKPGFKVGLGVNFDHDNWLGYVEYTWFHHKFNNSAFEGTWYPTSWVVSEAEQSSLGSSWRVNIDLADAVLSRPFYSGRKLTVSPFGGFRGAWIRQNFTVTGNSVYSNNHSHSWAVGPRVGAQAHWLLGWGFRFEGDAAAALLYTQYTKVSNLIYTMHDYNTLRPEVDMGVGIGWGSYLDRQNYHLDLLANYDFIVFTGQNMMRELANSSGSTGADFSAPGDLHLHGLTLTARFDF